MGFWRILSIAKTVNPQPLDSAYTEPNNACVMLPGCVMLNRLLVFRAIVCSTAVSALMWCRLSLLKLCVYLLSRLTGGTTMPPVREHTGTV